LPDPARSRDLRDNVAAMNRQRRRVIVTGRVQDVWYRDSCRTEALTRDVAGWVHNCPDGSVEAVFEGSPQAVEQMIAWCRVGPPRARVDNVEVTAEPVRNETGFVIR
jgi:acylphosphatase